jgi:hypothetical protein
MADHRTAERLGDRDYWVNRCIAGDEIPYVAIANHQLGLWFNFIPIGGNRDCYIAVEVPPRPAPVVRIH